MFSFWLDHWLWRFWWILIFKHLETWKLFNTTWVNFLGRLFFHTSRKRLEFLRSEFLWRSGQGLSWLKRGKLFYRLDGFKLVERVWFLFFKLSLFETVYLFYFQGLLRMHNFINAIFETFIHLKIIFNADLIHRNFITGLLWFLLHFIPLW